MLAAPWGGGGQRKAPFGCCLRFLRAGSVLSIQHLQMHRILERDRYLADLELDLLSAVVFPEGFSVQLGNGLKRQSFKIQSFK